MGSTAVTADQIGKLKRAAIDAWMKGQSVPVLGTFSISDGHYSLTGPGASVLVDRPGSDGSGGGTGTQSQTVSAGPFSSPHTTVSEADYTAQFDTIRARVDGLLEAWTELPTPSELEGYVEKCRTVSSRLSRTAWSDGGGVHRGAGTEIDSLLREIDADTEDFRGETARSFRKEILYKLPAVLENHLSLTLTRGGAMYGQQKLWAGARSDIENLVSSTTSVLTAIAHDGNGQAKRSLEVVDMMLEGIKLFTPGAVGKGIDLAKLGIKGATSSLPKEVTLDATSYEDAIGQLESALKTLNQHISAEELTARTAIKNHAEVTRNDETRGDYDLENPDLPGHSIIGLDAEKLRGIADSTLPSLAMELNSIADLNLSCSSPIAVSRDGRIGLGANGPGRDVADFDQYIHNLIEEAAGDALDGAVHLTNAINDFQETEEEIIRRLNQHLHGIDGVTADRLPKSPIDSPYPNTAWHPPMAVDAQPSDQVSPFFGLPLDELMGKDPSKKP